MSVIDTNGNIEKLRQDVILSVISIMTIKEYKLNSPNFNEPLLTSVEVIDNCNKILRENAIDKKYFYEYIKSRSIMFHYEYNTEPICEILKLNLDVGLINLIHNSTCSQ